MKQKCINPIWKMVLFQKPRYVAIPLPVVYKPVITYLPTNDWINGIRNMLFKEFDKE